MQILTKLRDENECVYMVSVAVPPDEPRIFDAQGKEISHIAGPFREGHEMFLSCQVTGGEQNVLISLLCVFWRR